MAKKLAPCKGRRIVVQDVNTKHYHTWSLPQLLREVNRDRSGEWQRYTKDDWKEGLETFTEYRFVKCAK